MSVEKLEELSVNSIRILAAEMVEKAKSGHPGLPLGAAPIAFTIWTKLMKHNPANPKWINRDRFVLSAGHGSALLYSLLHHSGYDLSIDDIKAFRQWGSKTPGHPEYGHTAGVETTTGPLGQGFANAVGMAIAESFLAGQFNQEDLKPVDYYTYVICGDGDLMEGISSEAASIAGHLKLGKLICYYDDNHISIEGSTNLAFTEDVAKRFEAYGWQVIEIDGNDLAAIEKAGIEAQKETNRPTLIKARTNIGYGSAKQDSASAHGEPLGADNLTKLKERFGFPTDKSFYIPEEVSKFFAKFKNGCAEKEKSWNLLLENYSKKYADKFKLWQIASEGKLPSGWDKDLPKFEAGSGVATRKVSGSVMNALAKNLPLMIGGSADLAPSNNTYLNGLGDFADNHTSPNLRFGVREHAMGAIVNGMALSGMVIPYGATFLAFADYMKPAIRLAALMQIKSIFIFTHDSIGLGEDGPTHQPIEHLLMLRSIPGLTLLRPADANETVEAWKIAVQAKGPVALIFTRQNLPTIDAQKYGVGEGVKRGGYTLIEGAENPDIILISTGSEVQLAMGAAETLACSNIKARVVSLPSWEIFEAQPEEYKNKVLPPNVTKRLAIEAGVPYGWERWTGRSENIMGITTFGASAPGDTLMVKYGFTVESVVAKAMKIVG
ncbi:MAG: transketolase [Nitrospinae bacterium]|nr:transketolase [Nitrospinota bacterium]